ncbi:universal stress protein [Paracoccus sp. TK19116]|uniref:Universal stress protein n=1 Tax=Paracoccus albicereus TaxID=2922394 RepID=A0ABT1MR67_9RHOB|nr:universal stress protein [Paracoccus albicereus]MCQ0970805.1 universal stress protein [Paracoccus albicereus]
MAYKSILTVLTEVAQMRQLDAAIALARQNDGHLEVFCLGVDRSQMGYYYAGDPAFVYQDVLDTAMEGAKALEKQIRERLSGEGDLRWSVDSAVAQAGGLNSLIAIRARFSDLMIQTHPYGEGAPMEAEPVTEAAMFDGGCPVLVLPAAAHPVWPPKRVVIAWNNSSEAMAAVRSALPVLTGAEAVEITVIDPRPQVLDRFEPGEALAQMLARHGVETEIAVIASAGKQVSEALNRRAIETAADLIVMGAYGHSRFRQAILGGATRNMLEKARVPVLMAR